MTGQQRYVILILIIIIMQGDGMQFKEEFEVLENFIRSRNLRRSEQRQQILLSFLKKEKPFNWICYDLQDHETVK